MPLGLLGSDEARLAFIPKLSAQSWVRQFSVVVVFSFCGFGMADTCFGLALKGSPRRAYVIGLPLFEDKLIQFSEPDFLTSGAGHL